MDVRSLTEFQGCQVLSYFVRGQVDRNEFAQELESQHRVKVLDLNRVIHEQWRNVPQGDEGMIIVPSKPGKGAYWVTCIDSSYVEVIKK